LYLILGLSYTVRKIVSTDVSLFNHSDTYFLIIIKCCFVVVIFVYSTKNVICAVDVTLNCILIVPGYFIMLGPA